MCKLENTWHFKLYHHFQTSILGFKLYLIKSEEKLLDIYSNKLKKSTWYSFTFYSIFICELQKIWKQNVNYKKGFSRKKRKIKTTSGTLHYTNCNNLPHQIQSDILACTISLCNLCSPSAISWTKKMENMRFSLAVIHATGHTGSKIKLIHFPISVCYVHIFPSSTELF